MCVCVCVCAFFLCKIQFCYEGFASFIFYWPCFDNIVLLVYFQLLNLY